MKKVLIVGTGMIGQVHAHTAQKMGIDFAFVTRNPAPITKIFGPCETYTDYTVALSASHADAVIICTPNHLHASYSIEAMEQGLDVLCEKPITATSEQAIPMLEAAKRTGRTLMVGYVLRQSQAMQQIKTILDNGTLGTLVSAHIKLAAPETLREAATAYRRSYETGGGILYDYSHELDYCTYLFGDVDNLFGYCDRRFKQDETADACVDTIMKLKNKMLVHMHFDYIQDAGPGSHWRTMEIVGENAFLETDFNQLTVHYHDGRTAKWSYPDIWENDFTTQLSAFQAYCEGKPGNCCTCEDGLKVLMLAEAIYKSADTGTPVFL